MDGVAALRRLLADHAALTAMVPEDRIVAGPLAQGEALPALSLESVSKVDRNIPNPVLRRHVRERVQVTVLARNYVEQKAVLTEVRRAASDRRPSVTGLVGVVVHTASAGPDFMNEAATIWMGSQDFTVTYNETR